MARKIHIAQQQIQTDIQDLLKYRIGELYVEMAKLLKNGASHELIDQIRDDAYARGFVSQEDRDYITDKHTRRKRVPIKRKRNIIISKSDRT